MIAQQQATDVQWNASDVSASFSRGVWLSRGAAALLLVLAAPLLLLLFAIVRCTSRGPALYRQERSGWRGRPYWMYKIRTMSQDAEATHGPVWARPGDSRITPVGRVLRFLHLDELPQLWNIVRGEMAFIGPRPERPKFVEELAKSIPGYTERLQVLPGVTGLAQINLPPDETHACVRRKLVLDRQYIATASLSLDARILICTALRMLGLRHGIAAHLMGVRRHVPSADHVSNGAPRHAADRQEHSRPVAAGALAVATNGSVNGSSSASPGVSYDADDVGFDAQETPEFSDAPSGVLVRSTAGGIVRRPK